MNKEVLKTKNFNNFALVSVNSDQSLFVKKYYELFKYKLHPSVHTYWVCHALADILYLMILVVNFLFVVVLYLYYVIWNEN